MSGALATAATYPFDVVRAYMAGTMDKEATSMIRVSKHIFEKFGVRGLYRGLVITIAGAVPYEGTRIGVYAGLLMFFFVFFLATVLLNINT